MALLLPGSRVSIFLRCCCGCERFNGNFFAIRLGLRDYVRLVGLPAVQSSLASTCNYDVRSDAGVWCDLNSVVTGGNSI